MSGSSDAPDGPGKRGTARPRRRVGAAPEGESGSAFEDDGRLTLELPVVALRLPDEAPPAVATPIPPPRSDRVPAVPDSTAPDAWATDRLSRRAPTPPPRQAVRPTRQLRVVRPATEPPPAGHGHALDLVDRSRPSSPQLDLSSEMTERFALGDFTGALFVAELLLGREENNVSAKACAAASRERLEQIYSSRVGSLKRVPVVAVRENDIRWLGLDHRAGFLLSRVDGRASLEEILDVSGMARLEALKTLVELYEAGAIRFGA
jgi:hypothetical protein